MGHIGSNPCRPERTRVRATEPSPTSEGKGRGVQVVGCNYMHKGDLLHTPKGHISPKNNAQLLQSFPLGDEDDTYAFTPPLFRECSSTSDADPNRGGAGVGLPRGRPGSTPGRCTSSRGTGEPWYEAKESDFL